MADKDYENTVSLDLFPNEILLYMFKFFSVKSLVISRRVCKRWKDLIDDIFSTENAWENNCAKDFPRNYKEAMLQTPYCESWYDLYKSLSLWEHLNTAKETIDEFCHSPSVADEIRSINILENGLICVHKVSSVIHIDLVTLEISSARPIIHGDFSRVYEIGDILILHGNHRDLTISRWDPGPEEGIFETQELVAFYPRIKMFTVHEKDIFLANQDNQLFKLGIFHDSPLKTYPNFLESGLVAMSHYNGLLHLITIGRSIAAFVNNKFELQLTLDSVSNVVHTLWKYNFLENIDWHVFYIWMAQLKVNVPDGPLRFICSLKISGDLFLLGSQCGVLRIYYKPFINGELNLFESQPIKQFNFSQRTDIPVLSLHPVIKIEVVEAKHGHKILVAMPRKILLISFNHEFGHSISKALLPYEELENFRLSTPYLENVVE